MSTETAAGKYRESRFVAGALAIAFALYGVRYGVKLLPHVLPIPLLAFAFAAILGWYALRGDSELDRRKILITTGIAVLVGGPAFLIGFVGPMIWTRDANQGPLLGLVFTGPAGFVVGAIAGAAIAARVVPASARDGAGRAD